MTKEYYFNLDQAQCDWAFKPIRNKKDVIEILMRVLKTISIYTEPPADQVAGKIKLHISKMSRIFFFNEGKYFSLAFPFTLELSGESLCFSSGEVEVIDNYITSKVLSIINDTSYLNPSLWAFFEPLIDIEDQQLIPGFWSFFKMLLTYEDGYIRYDVDPDRLDGRRHPLHHFDVFYSNPPTFKIGLNQPYSNDEMIDLLDRESDCHFFE